MSPLPDHTIKLEMKCELLGHLLDAYKLHREGDRMIVSSAWLSAVGAWSLCLLECCEIYHASGISIGLFMMALICVLVGHDKSRGSCVALDRHLKIQGKLIQKGFLAIHHEMKILEDGEWQERTVSLNYDQY